MLKVKVCFAIRVYIHQDNSLKTGSESKVTDERSTDQHPPVDGFFAYANGEIAHTHKMHRHSTAGNYATALRSFRKFRSGKDISLSSIDSRQIDDYSEWLQKEGISKDTLSCYMRSLRALYNKAVDRGLTEQRNPFRNVFTGITRTQKRSIEIADICKLREVKVKSGSFVQLVRDVFLFCFYACGMPFVDAAFLRKSQIADGMITYQRRKTDQFVQIKLEPCMEEIINRYWSDERDYVFPFLTSLDEDVAYKEYQSKFSYYNKTLKVLGKRAGINRLLSSYVARHTWATLAFRSSMDMSLISQALGHTNTKTTKIYVNDIGNPKQDIANEKLLKEVLNMHASVQEYIHTSVQEYTLTEIGMKYYNGDKSM